MHNRNSNAQRTLSGVSSTGALLQQQFQIPSTTSNPSLSNFANQQFANGSPDLQHQPTFQSSNQSQVSGRYGNSLQHQNSHNTRVNSPQNELQNNNINQQQNVAHLKGGVPQHGELRKKQREQNFQIMQEQYRLKKQQELEAAKNAKKAKQAQQQNKQNIMHIGNKNVKTDQQQYYPDLGPNNFLYMPNRQLNSAGSLMPQGNSRIKTFTQNNNFVQNLIIQPEEPNQAEKRQEEQLNTFIQKVESLIAQNKDTIKIDKQILSPKNAINVEKSKFIKYKQQTRSSIGDGTSSPQSQANYKTQKIDVKRQDSINTDRVFDSVNQPGRKTQIVKNNSRIHNQNSFNPDNVNKDIQLLSQKDVRNKKSSQTINQGNLYSQVRPSSLIHKRLSSPLLQSSDKSLDDSDLVSLKSSQGTLDKQEDQLPQAQPIKKKVSIVVNSDILVQKLQTLKLNQKKKSSMTILQEPKQGYNKLALIKEQSLKKKRKIQELKNDQYKLYDSSKYNFEQFKDKTLDFEMKEAFKYQFKTLKNSKIKALVGTKVLKKIENGDSKLAKQVKRSPSRRLTERKITMGVIEQARKQSTLVKQLDSQKTIKLLNKKGAEIDILENLYQNLIFLKIDGQEIKTAYLEKKEYQLILRDNKKDVKFDQKLLVNKISFSPQSKKVMLKELKTDFKYSQTDFQSRNFFMISPTKRPKDLHQLLDDYVFDQKIELQSNDGDITHRDQNKEEYLKQITGQAASSELSNQSLNIQALLKSPLKQELQASARMSQLSRSRQQFQFGATLSANFQAQNSFQMQIRKIKDMKHMQILTAQALQKYEDKFMEHYFKQKDVKKSLLKSLGSQVSNKKIMKEGVMLEEAQLADSILHMYWKQKINKTYYVFSKPEILDKIDFHFEEEKIEDQLIKHRIEIRYFVKEDDPSEKKQQDFYVNEMLNQLDIIIPYPQIERIKIENRNLAQQIPTSERKIMNLNLEILNHYFRGNMLYFYGQKNLIELNYEIKEIRKGCTKKLLDLANKEYFINRYESLIKHIYFCTRQAQNEKNVRREKKVQNQFGHKHFQNWEVHSLIKDYVFRRHRIAASDIVKTLFQSVKNNIFNLLYDHDEDYELSLTLDTILILTEFKKQKKLMPSQNQNISQLIRKQTMQGFKRQNKLAQNTQDKSHLFIKQQTDQQFKQLVDDTRKSLSIETEKNNYNDLKKHIMQTQLSNQEHDFLPLKRKNALRRNLEVKITRKLFTSNTLNNNNQVLQTRMFKRYESTVHNNLHLPIVSQQLSNRETSSRPNYSRPNNDIYFERSSSEDSIESQNISEDSEEAPPTKRMDQQSDKNSSNRKLNRFNTKISQRPQNQQNKRFSSKLGKIFENKNNQSNDQEFFQEDELINKFGYECVVQVCDSRLFMFEIFMPVEVLEEKFHEEDIEKDQFNNLQDSLTTNQSLRDFKDDKFADFDVNVQRQNLKKFFQQQKIKKSVHISQINLKGNSLIRPQSSNSLSKVQKRKITQPLVHNFQTIGTYYKNLTKRRKEETRLHFEEYGIQNPALDIQEDNNAAEVISVEELEDNDQDNFYLQMQNNVHIIQLLKEVGVDEKKSRCINMKEGKYNSMNPSDYLNKQNSNVRLPNFNLQIKGDKHSEIDSLFNNSEIWNEAASSADLYSQNSARSQNMIKNLNEISEENEMNFGLQKNLKLRLIQKAKQQKQQQNDFDKQQYMFKGSKYFQNSDFLRKNIYMKDQVKIESYIINAVTSQNSLQLKEFLPKYELSLDTFQDQHGNTLLIAATQLGAYDIVKQLLMQGSDPNVQNNDGNVAMHFSIKYGYTNITDLLISYGAKEIIQNKLGKTPWEDLD
eukprot:403366318